MAARMDARLRVLERYAAASRMLPGPTSAVSFFLPLAGLSASMLPCTSQSLLTGAAHALQ